MKPCALAGSAFLAYDLSDAFQFLRHLLIRGDDGIKSICDLSRESSPGAGEAYGEITIAHGLQAGQYPAQVGGGWLDGIN